MPRSGRKFEDSPSRRTVRLSVTLPADVHDALERVAERQRVSMAWVMRKAAEHYLDNENPLFATHVRDPSAGAS